MKRTMLALGIALGVGSTGYAFAGDGKPGADWMPADQVKQKVMDSGYIDRHRAGDRRRPLGR